MLLCYWCTTVDYSPEKLLQHTLQHHPNCIESKFSLRRKEHDISKRKDYLRSIHFGIPMKTILQNQHDGKEACINVDTLSLQFKRHRQDEEPSTYTQSELSSHATAAFPCRRHDAGSQCDISSDATETIQRHDEIGSKSMETESPSHSATANHCHPDEECSQPTDLSSQISSLAKAAFEVMKKTQSGVTFFIITEMCIRTQIG